MKPVNTQTIILPLIGWIYDFQKDNKRLPDSLEDLSANKSEARDYNSGRIISRNKNDGFTFMYAAPNSESFEIKISKDNNTAAYDSTTDTLSFYEGGALLDQIKLKP